MSDLITNGLNNYSTYTNSASSSTNSLEKTLGSGDFSNATDEELMEVCKDFESYFVEQVFKSMEKMSKIDADEEESSSMSSMVDYFKDEMYTQYASAASESNGGDGLGIAQTLYEQMKRNYGSSNIPGETSEE